MCPRNGTGMSWRDIGMYQEVPGCPGGGVRGVLGCPREDSRQSRLYGDVPGRISGDPGSMGMPWDVPEPRDGPGADGDPRPPPGGGTAERQRRSVPGVIKTAPKGTGAEVKILRSLFLLCWSSWRAKSSRGGQVRWQE